MYMVLFSIVQVRENLRFVLVFVSTGIVKAVASSLVFSDWVCFREVSYPILRALTDV